MEDRESEVSEGKKGRKGEDLQGSRIRLVRGLVKFVPAH